MNQKLIGLVFAIIFAIGVMFLRSDIKAQSSTPNQTGPQIQVAGLQPAKNLQVLTELKDISSSQELYSVMDVFTASLSVSCNYCHVIPNVGGAAPAGAVPALPTYDSDAKKTKLIARDMIKMTRAINEANFGGRTVVTCNTCHQGNTHPKGVPTPWYKTPEEIVAYNKSVASGQPDASTTVSTPTLPDVDTVIANYRKAVGIASLKTLTITGTTSINGVIEISAIFPDKVRVRQTGGVNPIDVVFNGGKAWSISPQGAIRPLPLLNPFKQIVDLFLPVRNTKTNSPQKVTGIEKIGAGNCYVVSSQNGKRTEKLYFDVQSGLLHKHRIETETMLGTGVTETTYEDYHDVSGVKIPYSNVIHFGGNQQFAKITDAKVNIAVDAAKFDPPPAPPEPKSIKVDPRILDTYLGQYQLTPTTVITFIREGGRFLVNQPTAGQLEVFAESETEFFLKDLPIRMTFVKNAQGQVTHLVLHQNGTDRELKKVR